jgi:hypothetical protein
LIFSFVVKFHEKIGNHQFCFFVLKKQNWTLFLYKK